MTVLCCRFASSRPLQSTSYQSHRLIYGSASYRQWVRHSEVSVCTAQCAPVISSTFQQLRRLTWFYFVHANQPAACSTAHRQAIHYGTYSVSPAGNRCHFVLLNNDESCPTADRPNIGCPNGSAYSTGELFNTPRPGSRLQKSTWVDVKVPSRVESVLSS